VALTRGVYIDSPLVKVYDDSTISGVDTDAHSERSGTTGEFLPGAVREGKAPYVRILSHDRSEL